MDRYGSPQELKGQGGVYALRGKRILDIVLSSIGLLLLLPLITLVAVLVRCTSPGPAFYRQERVGRFGKTFQIVKFRSMVVNADKCGLSITKAGDSRVTRVGTFLRKWKIDELPQLWNVFRGEMSLVGPRPELPLYVSTYTTDQREVLSVTPGITDIASICYRDEEAILASAGDADDLYRKVVLPHKLMLNRQYIRTISFGMDIKLILKTLALLLFPSRDKERVL